MGPDRDLGAIDQSHHMGDRKNSKQDACDA
jgi:hypothetical protein